MALQIPPAESRAKNERCVFLNFYDEHDIWHMLSACGMFFALLVYTWLCNPSESNIVFTINFAISSVCASYRWWCGQLEDRKTQDLLIQIYWLEVFLRILYTIYRRKSWQHKTLFLCKVFHHDNYTHGFCNTEVIPPW